MQNRHLCAVVSPQYWFAVELRYGMTSILWHDVHSQSRINLGCDIYCAVVITQASPQYPGWGSSDAQTF